MNKYLTLIKELSILINNLNTKLKDNYENEVAASISLTSDKKMVNEYESDLIELKNIKRELKRYPTLIGKIRKKYFFRFLKWTVGCSILTIGGIQLFCMFLNEFISDIVVFKVLSSGIYTFLFSIVYGLRDIIAYLEESIPLKSLKKHYTLEALDILIDTKDQEIAKLKAEIVKLSANVKIYLTEKEVLVAQKNELEKKVAIAQNKYNSVLALPEVEAIIDDKFCADLSLNRLLNRRETPHE